MSKNKTKKNAVQSFSVAGRQAPGDHYTEILLSCETKVLRKETPYHTIIIRVETPLFIVQPSWTATVCMAVAAVGKTQAKLVRTAVLVKHTYWKGRANVQPTHIKTAKRNSLYHFHNLPWHLKWVRVKKTTGTCEARGKLLSCGISKISLKPPSEIRQHYGYTATENVEINPQVLQSPEALLSWSIHIRM